MDQKISQEKKKINHIEKRSEHTKHEVFSVALLPRRTEFARRSLVRNSLFLRLYRCFITQDPLINGSWKAVYSRCDGARNGFKRNNFFAKERTLAKEKAKIRPKRNEHTKHEVIVTVS